MPYEIIDGFESYVTAQLGLDWPINSSSDILTTSPTTGLQHLRTQAQGFVQRAFSSNAATCLMGAHFQIDTIGNDRFLMVLFDNGTEQVDLRLDASGHLKVNRGATNLGISSAVILPATKYHIAWKIKVHGSTGTFEVRVNDVVVTSGTGVNTSATGNAYATDYRLGFFSGGNGAGANLYWDNVYVYNGNGTFPGDVKVEEAIVNGNGSQQDFTASPAVSHVLNVDDASPDSDSTYNAGGTSGNIELYTFAAFTTLTGTIHAVQTTPTMRKDDAGARTAKSIIRISGTDYLGATDYSLGNSYLTLPEIWETNPATAAAWTQSGLNAAEIGIKVTS